jgi:hypothetical protein
MFDLFDAPAVPGLAIKNDMFTPAEEAKLIAAIDRESLSPFRFRQWSGKRLTRSFGWSYDFENGSFVQAERGPVWWDDGAPDFNRRMVRNSPYADWFAELATP